MKGAYTLAVVIILVIAGGAAYFAFHKGDAGTQSHSYSATSVQVTDGDCLSIQGAHICPKTTAMSNASTTCSFKSPTATSTFRGSATFKNTYGGSFDIEWGKGTNAYSTTTTLGYKPAAISSGDQGTFVATSTGATGASLEDVSNSVAPNTFVNFKVGSTTPTLAGTCFGEFTY